MPFFLVAPLTWLSNGAFAFIVWFVSRRGITITIGLSLIALVGLAINTLINAIDANIGNVFSDAVPFVTPFIPSNTGLCVSLIVSTELAATTYRLTLQFLDWKSRILFA